MPLPYLDLLDTLFTSGIARFGAGFLARQAAYVRARQMADGGFRGRQGPSDPYYTDFALRVLMLCGDEDAYPATARYLDALPVPADLVEATSRLSAARILRHAGVPCRTDGLPDAVERQRVAGGGYARPHDTAISAYQTFLAFLCHAIAETDLPGVAPAVVGIRALRHAGSGSSDLPGEPPQTNSTAAAAAFLLAHQALEEEDVAGIGTFLQRMQAADGGLRAHAGAPIGDLLSTFTGLTTATTLGIETLNLPAIGRFTKGMALPTGGFRGSAFDEAGDVEYTFYGLGTLALLSARL